jgi:NNP family nitrate/nitrite transporter-like MFS transporter
MGIKLTADYVVSVYYFDHFHLDLNTAGTIAACFGLVNLVARPMAGYLSDLGDHYFVIRACLWNIWILQTDVVTLLQFVPRLSVMPFGFAPFISRRSFGMISELNRCCRQFWRGAHPTDFFKSSQYSTGTGLQYMGIMIMCCTLPVTFVHFR